jgi:hypothetical protein
MYDLNPFGNPDGSRVSIENMMNEFITFDSKYYPLLETNFRTRVIVGAKGSGKTVYLRRMQALIKNNDSVYTTEIASELPGTDIVVRFCQIYDINILTEKWMLLWRCAILRSLTSHILADKNLRDYLDKSELSAFDHFTDKLYPKILAKMDVYAEVRNILSFYENREQFDSYFSYREWDILDALLSGILVKLPPIYFFIDCIDDEYSHAPMYWMRCQKGLFYRCMRFLRHPVYGGKLHIVICVRDQVMSSVYQSEHSTRYMNDSHILSLNWNYRSIEYFFDHKISRLNDDYFKLLDETHEKSISNWLGVTTINNVVRGIDEPISEYILRHTRLSPRDIVEIGNALAAIARESVGTTDFDLQSEIRRKVANCARSFGNELLAICANQIINNQMPDSAGRMDYTEVYTSIKEYCEQTSSGLRSIISELPSDRFTWNDIHEIIQMVDNKELLPKDHHMFDIMWQNGAIGYLEPSANGEPKEVFFVDANYELFTLPKHKDQYLLRSCLIDCTGKSLISNKPIIGGDR